MTLLPAMAQSPKEVRHRKRAQRRKGSGPRPRSKDAGQGPALSDHESRKARTLAPQPELGTPCVRKGTFYQGGAAGRGGLRGLRRNGEGEGLEARAATPRESTPVEAKKKE